MSNAPKNTVADFEKSEEQTVLHADAVAAIKATVGADKRGNGYRNKALVACIKLYRSAPEKQRGSAEFCKMMDEITGPLPDSVRNKFRRCVKDDRINDRIDDFVDVEGIEPGEEVEAGLKSILAEAPKAVDYFGACRKIVDKRQDGEPAQKQTAKEVSLDGQEQSKMLKEWFASKRKDLPQADIDLHVANAIVQLEKLNTKPVAELPDLSGQIGSQSDNAATGTND